MTIKPFKRDAYTLDTFTANAGDLIRLRATLYGAADAQQLMLRCFRRQIARRSSASKCNERTVLACWSEQDAEIHAESDAIEDQYYGRGQR